MFANIGDIGGSQPLGWVWRENAYTWQQNQPTPPSISRKGKGGKKGDYRYQND